ncbi:MAG: OmpA family protein [Bacteroidota bacterium]
MISRSIIVFSLALLGSLGNILHAQKDVIALGNPSFEDRPHVGRNDRMAPRGWYDCGAYGESAPDVQPSPNPNELFFAVTTPAQDGNTYMGMVVRQNETWEGVGQRLSRVLEGGKCYTFSLNLAKSDRYLSPDPRNQELMINHSKPVKIRVWGGNTYCGQRELLDETPLINHSDWRQYDFRFEPVGTYSYILIEAFYKQPTLIPYNGNVLVDNASSVSLVPCIEDEPLASVDKKVNVSPKPKKEPVATPEPPPVPPKKRVEEPTRPAVKELLGYKKEELEEGQKIRINKLYFKVNSSTLNNDSRIQLDKIHRFLVDNPEVIVELGGHTNNRCQDSYCDQLSMDRAKAVADYLADRGVAWRQLKYKGYGRHEPVATNKTPTGRKRNQRVEIKILKLTTE